MLLDVQIKLDAIEITPEILNLIAEIDAFKGVVRFGNAGPGTMGGLAISGNDREYRSLYAH